MLPSWLVGLFTPTSQEVPLEDTSTNLQKQAHSSELVRNLLSDVSHSCMECERPVQFEGLCDKCTKESHTASYLHDPDICDCGSANLMGGPSCECGEPQDQCGDCGKIIIHTKPHLVKRDSLVSELEKKAGAYEIGDSEANTSAKSHESQIKALSNFAMAEYLTEFRLKGQGVAERWSSTFPEVLQEVQKSRKKCEQELLEFIPLPAVIDRMKFLSEVMKGEFEPTESKNLYGELFEAKGKQTWESAKNSWKDEVKSEKEKYANQMPEESGPGREANDERGHLSPRSVDASLDVEAKGERERIRQLKDQLDKTKDPGKIRDIYQAIDAAEDRMKKDKDRKDERREQKEQKKEEVKPKEQPVQVHLTKAAGAHDLDDLQLVPQDKYLVYYHKIEGGERYYKWFSTEDSAEKYKEDIKARMFATEAKVKDFSKEFKLPEQKTIQKEAEVASPWAVVKQDDKEVIARITPEEVFKKSKEQSPEVSKEAHGTPDKKVECPKCKKRELHIGKFGYHWCDSCGHEFGGIGKEASFNKLAKDIPDVVQSLEGLTPEQQVLWKEHYSKACSWALADPIARKIGRAETIQAAMIALHRAIGTWNPQHASKAQFTSYLFRAIHNELLTTLNHEKMIPEKAPEGVEMVQIDKPVSEGDSLYGSDTLQDLIEDVEAKLPDVEMEEKQEAEFNKKVALTTVKLLGEELEGQTKTIYDLFVQGYNTSEIARMLNLTIPAIVRQRQVNILPLAEEIMAKVRWELKQKPTLPSKKEPELAYSPLPEKEE